MDRTQTRLKPEDQAKVDDFLNRGTNATERNAFRPFKLMLWLAAIIVVLGVLSRVIGVFILG
ncbi:hypothetical protein GZ77_19705 [Endozoicomonas montiporae]|uniref:50s ribosomal protein l13 n=2 Tax=Endozoicomonas montiporae TaxID=1027273 RepID=A0A081N2N4_9GAMM|nr:DUF3094 family protein [Endozoicomonas montiporae]AMO57965.1 hypothetical protein EZMO1_4030 [Endozoicomonas montiporae CL-33]KEQ12707.1 hypothetical protein GZ77_19705 [Endozoicomonas montiporae]